MAVGYGNEGAVATLFGPGLTDSSVARGLRFEAAAGDLTSAPKRLFDVAISLLAIVCVAPLFALIAVLVKVDSQGPVFVRQQRVGKRFRRFAMLKFRSMVADAENRREELIALNESDGPIFKIRRDPRVTRVGAFLRRSSLDELPQLINVLRGEMSLVGPRPPFPDEVVRDHYRQSQRLRCTPGMTGIWQVSGRSELGYDAMVQMDLRYLRQASFRTDVEILLRTIPAVLRGKGAW